MLAAAQTSDAVSVLEHVRAEKPDDADAPYLLATIYFEAHRWSEGLAAAQAAVERTPASGPTAISSVASSARWPTIAATSGPSRSCGAWGPGPRRSSRKPPAATRIRGSASVPPSC